ncbi:MAG: aminodeoxychorismate synthase component I [Elusimicrobiota bacterium]
MENILPKNCRFAFAGRGPDKESGFPLQFVKPSRVLALNDPSELDGFFGELETLTRRYYVAGFFSYEFGYLLEPKFGRQCKSRFPYAVFAAFNGVSPWSGGFGGGRRGNYGISGLRLDVPRRRYVSNVSKLKRYIAAGDIYQANYTMKYKFGFSGSPEAFFEDLAGRQGAEYNFFARFGDIRILSASPELFFRIKGRKITVKPMKGTICRGRFPREDMENAAALALSRKDRSENVMIVDVLRNDLGRIAERGSVRTTKLFEVEKYKTLFQMTSSVEAKLKKGTGLKDLFKAIYPSASVTGAPKIRAMEIIRETENEPRKVYTGAVGFFKPGGDALFSVAIRTALLEGARGEMGIGSGIVNDSSPGKEYEECRLKGSFFTPLEKLHRMSGRRKNSSTKLCKNTLSLTGFTDNAPDFCLRETMLYDGGMETDEHSRQNNKGSTLITGRHPAFMPRHDRRVQDGGIRNLTGHIERLASSCGYFGFSLDRKHILKKLAAFTEKLGKARHRVRLKLSKNGVPEIIGAEIQDSELAGKEFKIKISGKRTDTGSVFLYHKTSNRELYDSELKKARSRGFDDVIFTNEKGDVTEGARTNIYAEIKGSLFTPPISSGLLEGTVRRRLVKSGRAKEKVLRPSDLKNADRIFVSNAVIGFVEATLRRKTCKA